MHAVSDRWTATAAGSHEIVTAVTVGRGRDVLIDRLPIDGGQVVHDLGAAITSTCEVQLADPALLPVDDSSPLAPGSWLAVATGLRHADGSAELLAVFHGPIVSAPAWSGPGQTLTVKAESWLRYVMDDRLLRPYSPPAGSPVADAVAALVAAAIPADLDWTWTSAAPARAVPDGMLWEEDRWQAVDDLARAAGCRVRPLPDLTGAALAPDPAPDPAAAPVRHYQDGAAGTLLAGSRPDLTREGRYNAVVASNPDDPAVWAVAETTEGPMAVDGPFGRRAMFYASPLLATVEQAQQAAATRLSNLAGRLRTITADILPDPAVQPGDHVTITWPPAPGSGLRPTETAMVTKATHPLGPGRSVLELRSVPVGGGGRV